MRRRFKGLRVGDLMDDAAGPARVNGGARGHSRARGRLRLGPSNFTSWRVTVRRTRRLVLARTSTRTTPVGYRTRCSNEPDRTCAPRSRSGIPPVWTRGPGSQEGPEPERRQADSGAFQRLTDAGRVSRSAAQQKRRPTGQELARPLVALCRRNRERSVSPHREGVTVARNHQQQVRSPSPAGCV